MSFSSHISENELSPAGPLGRREPFQSPDNNCLTLSKQKPGLKADRVDDFNRGNLYRATASRRPLSILVITQYFFPENFTINGIVADLVARGHDVTVVTGMPNYPSGVFADGYGGMKLIREKYKDAAVIRVPIVVRGRDSKIRLAMNYLSYALSASILAPFVVRDRPDAILVYQLSPAMLAFPALVIRLFRGSKILLWVQDIWPDSIVATGAMRNRLVLGVLRQFMRLIYSCSAIIAVQSSQFVDFLGPLISADKKANVRRLPNIIERFYRVVDVPPDAPERKLFRSGFNILFAGNLGIAQDFETILDAIELVKGQANIQWVFIGDGRRRPWIESEIQRRNLADHVQVLGPFSPEEMPALFAIADALLITLRSERIFSLTVPSKLQAYLACGRAILGAVSGETANIIHAAGAGLVAPPSDPESLAKTALTLARTPREQLEHMGKSGCEYYQREFSSERTLGTLESWLRELSDPVHDASKSTTN